MYYLGNYNDVRGRLCKSSKPQARIDRARGSVIDNLIKLAT